jgi:hypothetical protein
VREFWNAALESPVLQAGNAGRELGAQSKDMIGIAAYRQKNA